MAPETAIRGLGPRALSGPAHRPLLEPHMSQPSTFSLSQDTLITHTSPSPLIHSLSHALAHSHLYRLSLIHALEVSPNIQH